MDLRTNKESSSLILTERVTETEYGNQVWGTLKSKSFLFPSLVLSCSHGNSRAKSDIYRNVLVVY
jgi:hypothetical protein